MLGSEALAAHPTIADLGEQALLQRLQRYCPAGVVGDDAAVLTPSPGHLLVVTTDMLVDGVHFCDRTTAPADIGWRTAAANLSDLAAMGATPLGATVSLGLPPSLPVAQLEHIYQGMTACLNRHQTPLVGGDLCRSPHLTLSMTALGQVLPHQQIQRSTAQPGDAIVISGPHGASRAGLELLLHPEWGPDLAPEHRAQLCQAHQRPQPRLDLPPLLRHHHPQVRITGMDSSDGLADAILQICRASHVGAQIDRSKIPLPVPLQHTQALSATQALDWALFGGEDFELVLCLPETLALACVQTLHHQGYEATIVGRIVPQADVVLLDTSGQFAPKTLSFSHSFQHFAPH